VTTATLEVAPGVHRISVPLPFPPGEVAAWVIEGDGGHTLVDTGIDTPPARWALREAAGHVGVTPESLEYVVLTHAHPDHCWGLMSENGSRNFPNAQIYIAQSDLEFWTDDRRAGTPAEGSMLAAKKNLLPNRDRIVFYSDGKEVIPGVQAMLTPGHTVGHTSFVINSGDKSLFLTGDLIHHVILIEKPQMEVAFDTDPKQGVQTRIKMMDMLAAQRMLTLVYHLPWPGLGHFAKQGEGFRFIAEPMQVVL
jgi:glyoxylase-like metal-dependent hydrolase (beta-lactamase superfamily II)